MTASIAWWCDWKLSTSSSRSCVRYAAPARDGEPLALLRRHREERHRIGRVVQAEQLVLARGGGEAAHHRCVDPLVILDLEEHLLVDAGWVALAHEVVERGGRLLDVLPDLGRVQQRALEQGGGDVLAAARALAGDERGEDPARDQEARAHARHRHGQEDRAHPPTGLLPLLAAARLDQRVVPGPIGEAVALGVAGARAVHEARVARVHRVVPDAEPVGDARTERLHEHVGVVDQAAERLPARVRLQVDRDRPSRPVPHRVAAVGAERVTARWLDLHHVCALLREQHHAERPRDAPGQVEDLHAVECTHRRRSLAHT